MVRRETGKELIVEVYCSEGLPPSLTDLVI